MSKRLDENLGSVGYDGLIVANEPVADVLTVTIRKEATAAATYKRGTVMALSAGTDGDGNLVILGSTATTNETLTANCILGITANEKRCRELLDASVGITTALCPYIGYKKAASLAKESLKTDIPVKTLVLKYGLLKESELDSILDPYAMTEARTRQTQAKAV